MFSARVITRAFRAPIARTLTRASSTAPRTLLASTWKSSALRQPRLAASFSSGFRAFEKQGVGNYFRRPYLPARACPENTAQLTQWIQS